MVQVAHLISSDLIDSQVTSLRPLNLELPLESTSTSTSTLQKQIKAHPQHHNATT